MGSRGRETLGTKVDSSLTLEDSQLEEQQKATDNSSDTHTLSDPLIHVLVEGEVGLYFRCILRISRGAR